MRLRPAPARRRHAFLSLCDREAMRIRHDPNVWPLCLRRNGVAPGGLVRKPGNGRSTYSAHRSETDLTEHARLHKGIAFRKTRYAEQSSKTDEDASFAQAPADSPCICDCTRIGGKTLDIRHRKAIAGQAKTAVDEALLRFGIRTVRAMSLANKPTYRDLIVIIRAADCARRNNAVLADWLVFRRTSWTPRKGVS